MTKTTNKPAAAPDVSPPTVHPRARSASLPAGAIHIDTYREYLRLLRKWASGKLDDTLVVIGSAGIGKSEMALAALRNVDHCYVKGQATRYGVYLQLLAHIDQPVVLDDVDVLLQSKEVTGLLKMLLETRSPKIIQWSTGATLKDDSGVPPKFATKSRTMVLCNELKQVSKNFSAVLDRATILWFAPSPTEIHRYAAGWVKDQTVYKFVGERIHGTPVPSCRYYYHGQKWKQAGLNWQRMLEKLMLPDESKALLVREIDAKFKASKDRVAEWKRQTGETAQSYYNTRRAVLLKHGVRSQRGRMISEGMKLRHEARKLGLPPRRPDKAPPQMAATQSV